MQSAATGPFPYSSIVRRPRLTWPSGARLAFWVIPNVEAFALNERMPSGSGKVPEVLSFAVRDYGARVGIWRVMESLSRRGIRATAALNSDVCDAYPEIVKEAVRLKWEFMGHNQSNTRRLNEIPATEERHVIHESLSRIEREAGSRPVGWLSSGLQETWNTLDYLVEENCRYVADWVNDDQPYVMTVQGKPLVSIPYSVHLNDKPAFEQDHRTADEFEMMIRRQFDVLYQESAVSGRVMALALHPYIIGVPHRIGALNSALDYICSHEGVWLATGEEIADAYMTLLHQRRAVASTSDLGLRS
ncbi:MAG: polysaccharide deacetylase family protein [Acidobacteria bacterium]|nr:polysaccharide deacetylase family protein [Acidobacteriota bacterium]